MLSPYSYTVRLADTDAARVVYFASILRICHEAYEESFNAAAVKLWSLLTEGEILLPIVSCQARFLRPIFYGDQLSIVLHSQSIEASEYQVNYQITPAANPTKVLAVAETCHVCIDSQSRQRQKLPDLIWQWLDLSSGEIS
jgi:1,4-dihydroxy-2-naphthoyl-CoA hydrolase